MLSSPLHCVGLPPEKSKHNGAPSPCFASLALPQPMCPSLFATHPTAEQKKLLQVYCLCKRTPKLGESAYPSYEVQARTKTMQHTVLTLT